MPKNPKNVSNRPNKLAAPADVLSGLLRTLRFGNVLFGHFELGEPWGLRMPGHGQVSFYVILSGRARLQIERDEVPLGPGDVAMVIRTGVHQLRGSSNQPIDLHDLASQSCPSHPPAMPVKLGGSGPRTSILAGSFQVDEPHALSVLRGLPPLLHLRADVLTASPALGATIQVLIAETVAHGPGSSLILSRLADVMLVQAIRLHGITAQCSQPGLLRALADPAISNLLGTIHQSLDKPWTVDSMAATCGMSRSSFAARFKELVGEPPLVHLTRWRMAKAAELLRQTGWGTADIMARAGYASEAAFHRTFRRYTGMTLGGYRQSVREKPTHEGNGGAALATNPE